MGNKDKWKVGSWGGSFPTWNKSEKYRKGEENQKGRRRKTDRERKKGGEKKRVIFLAFRSSKLDSPRIKVGPRN